RQGLGDRSVQRLDRQPSTATSSNASFEADLGHLNSGSSPSVVSWLVAFSRHETDPEIEGSLTLSPRCAVWGHWNQRMPASVRAYRRTLRGCLRPSGGWIGSDAAASHRR